MSKTRLRQRCIQTKISSCAVLGLAAGHTEKMIRRYVDERPHRYHGQLMSVFVSAGLISVPGTPCKHWKEVLHLFRCFTHTHIMYIYIYICIHIHIYIYIYIYAVYSIYTQYICIHILVLLRWACTWQQFYWKTVNLACLGSLWPSPLLPGKESIEWHNQKDIWNMLKLV